MTEIADIVMASLNEGPRPMLLSQLIFSGPTNKDRIVLDNNSKTITSDSSVEFTQSSLQPNESETKEFLLKIPACYDRLSITFSDSIEAANLKCVLSSDTIVSTFQINSVNVKLPLSEDLRGHLKLRVQENGKELLIFPFYREVQNTKTTTETKTTQSSEPESSFSEFDLHIAEKDLSKKEVLQGNPFPIPMPDGPLFRDAINTYEQLAPLILNQIQSTVTKLNKLDQSMKSLDDARSNVFDSLKEFKKEFLPFVPKNDLVSSKFESVQNSSNDLTHDFLKALRHSINETNIDFSAFKSLQNFSSSKKNFEEESKKFYDWLSKLMSSGKSKDEKLLHKMKIFEVSKMQYFNYLYDTVTPLLLSIIKPESSLTEEYWINRPKREYAIKKIQNCSSIDDLSKLMQKYSIVKSSKTSLLLTDKQSEKNDTSLKTGLLFVFGGQGKSGWHKQWLVLQNGKLYEYMDWRKGAELRNAPIDISLCNIKLLDSNDHKTNNIGIGSRKNCFRVINAQGVEHVFQAFTPAEANAWVKALFEAGQMIAFSKQNSKGTSSKKSLVTNKPKLLTNNSFNSLSSKKSSQLATSRIRRVSSVSSSLLHVVQRADPSNTCCADCGSKDQVEWISLNLLVVFCIQCSSAHRALGTNVSKVRSLMLDSFVGENRVLVHHISNSFANSVYEAELSPASKPTVNSTNEYRLEFITNKYLKRLYVSDSVKAHSSEILLAGVREDDVCNVIKGLAGGADVNKMISVSSSPVDGFSGIKAEANNSGSLVDISFLEYALLHPSMLDGREVFDIAELLALNGCDAGMKIPTSTPVDSKGQKWWQNRIDKMNGVISVPSKERGGSSQETLSMQGKVPLRKVGSSNTKRTSTGNTPSISMNNIKPTGGKSKLRSPKEGFNLFKKKLKNLE